MEMYLRHPVKDLEIGTVCRVENEAIYHGNRFICMVGSETGKNFCINTENEIKRADILEELIPLDPPGFYHKDFLNPEDTTEKYYDMYWSNWGEDSPWGWQWNNEILELPVYKLEELLRRIKE